MKQRRREERGAAVFVVVLVVTMLSAIGMFAARSATLNTTSSGYMRQMTQTHYVTEYGMLAAMAEIATKPSAYIDAMKSDGSNGPTCKKLVDGKVANPACYEFGHADLQTMLNAQNAGAKLLDPANPGASPPAPGSLGYSALEADFSVTMTDMGPAGAVAGMSVGGPSSVSLQYATVTLSATGVVRPPTANKEAASRAASIESIRARLIVGPLPK